MVAELVLPRVLLEEPIEIDVPRSEARAVVIGEDAADLDGRHVRRIFLPTMRSRMACRGRTSNYRSQVQCGMAFVSTANYCVK
jgi:hypothetical protein